MGGTLRTAGLRSTAARDGRSAFTTTTRSSSSVTLPLLWAITSSLVQPPERRPKSSTPLGTSGATMVKYGSSCTIRPYRTRLSQQRPPVPTSIRSWSVPEVAIAPSIDLSRFVPPASPPSYLSSPLPAPSHSPADPRLGAAATSCERKQFLSPGLRSVQAFRWKGAAGYLCPPGSASVRWRHTVF